MLNNCSIPESNSGTFHFAPLCVIMTPIIIHTCTASPYSRTVMSFISYNYLFILIKVMKWQSLLIMSVHLVLPSTKAELSGVEWCAVDKTCILWMLEGRCLFQAILSSLLN